VVAALKGVQVSHRYSDAQARHAFSTRYPHDPPLPAVFAFSAPIALFSPPPDIAGGHLPRPRMVARLPPPSPDLA
jgi:hypothetical protein